MYEGDLLGSQVRLLGQLLTGREIGPHADWEALLDLACRYRLSPLLHWHIQKQEVQSRMAAGKEANGPVGFWFNIPEPARERLRQDYFVATAHAALVEQQLAQVLEILRLAGIPVVVVKGAALAAAYPEPALRTYKDLDLLVPRVDLERAEEALKGLGYRGRKPKEWALAQHYHLPPMGGTGFQLEVEVHWRLDEAQGTSALPVDDLWRRAQPWSIAGQQALRLDAVDATLYLCKHALVQHRGRQGLRPLCDLAHMTDCWQPAQWQALEQRANEYGLGPVVYLMLTLEEQLLGMTAPAGVVEGLRPEGLDPLPEDLLERLLPGENSLAAHVPMALVRAEGKETVLAGVRHFFSRLLLPREAMAAIYGVPADSACIWLTFLWRPLDLLRRYGVSVGGALWGSRSARAAWRREAWLERWLTEADRVVGSEHRSV